MVGKKTLGAGLLKFLKILLCWSKHQSYDIITQRNGIYLLCFFKSQVYVKETNNDGQAQEEHPELEEQQQQQQHGEVLGKSEQQHSISVVSKATDSVIQVVKPEHHSSVVTSVPRSNISFVDNQNGM
jgi:hypothetical protein